MWCEEGRCKPVPVVANAAAPPEEEKRNQILF
jgi:hypothetical protein